MGFSIIRIEGEQAMSSDVDDSRTAGIGSLPETVRSGQLVVCEEAARDGAQAKTLLLASERIELFRRTSEVLGEAAETSLVSMVGFPAIGPEEQAVIQETTDGFRVGYQQVVCRTIAEDITQGIALMRSAHAGRVLFVVPASEKLAGPMLHLTPEQALKRAHELLGEALDVAAGEVAVDVCLADIAHADPGHLVDAANALTHAGAEVVMLADTVGGFHLTQQRQLMERLARERDEEVVFHAHFHNDLGLASALNLQALQTGVRMFGTSWLGLGERVGLGHTEELLAQLVTASDAQLADLGTERESLGVHHWNPEQIRPTAAWLSSVLELPRRITDPFVGTGVNAISTGTPFVDPQAFQPYDASRLLGKAQSVELTHLASSRVIAAILEELDEVVTDAEVRALRSWTKAEVYERGVATLPKSALRDALHRLRSLV